MSDLQACSYIVLYNRSSLIYNKPKLLIGNTLPVLNCNISQSYLIIYSSLSHWDEWLQSSHFPIICVDARVFTTLTICFLFKMNTRRHPHCPALLPLHLSPCGKQMTSSSLTWPCIFDCMLETNVIYIWQLLMYLFWLALLMFLITGPGCWLMWWPQLWKQVAEITAKR